MIFDPASVSENATPAKPAPVKIRVTHPRGVAEEAELMIPHLGHWHGQPMQFDHDHCVKCLMRALERHLQQSETGSVQRWKDATEYHFHPMGND
ncbi:MAG: hypothetical protein ACK6D3_23695 [Planctomycetaceae bacterium]